MNKILKVGFSRNSHNKIFSVMLQNYMNREYSHCFIEFDTAAKLGDNAIYHSSLSAGIGYMCKSIFEEDNLIVKTYEIEISEEAFLEVRQKLFTVCGRKYGLWQNFGIAIVDLCRHLGFRVSNPWTNNENCSEMLYRHVISVLFKDRFVYDPNNITPSDIEKIVKEIGTLRG